MKIIVSVLLFSLLMATAVESGEVPMRDLTIQESALVEAAVKERLLDPDSARFRWMQVPSNFNFHYNRTYCGIVNSRNRFGGYTGGAPFYVDVWMVLKKADATIGDADTNLVWYMREGNTNMVLRTCAESGFKYYKSNGKEVEVETKRQDANYPPELKKMEKEYVRLKDQYLALKALSGVSPKIEEQYREAMKQFEEVTKQYEELKKQYGSQ